MGASFDEKAVAAALNVAALPPGPLTRHQQILDLAPQRINASPIGADRFQVGTLTLIERVKGRWAVRDLTVRGPVRYLNTTGHWSTHGGDGPDWERAYWHDFDTAVALATDDHRCLCCGTPYTAESRAGVRDIAVCGVPTEDEAPVPGYDEIEVPAWCAVRRAFVWRGAEGLEFDR
ncbi:hypothetical protein [Dactylosporangium salmoneum]|uniref:Uncharacterized protein n=1 Tax=Dactylosporangium salmoneum TaxID=53361 RepID=A0ABP5T8N1_9ACTN